MIAQRSRGTPRIANRLLRRVRDFAEVRADGRITRRVADEALRAKASIDRGSTGSIAHSCGRSPKHYGGGPVGINAIAATLTEDVETLEDVVEPYLLKIGFVQRTASGRADARGVRASAHRNAAVSATSVAVTLRRAFICRALGGAFGRSSICVWLACASFATGGLDPDLGTPPPHPHLPPAANPPVRILLAGKHRSGASHQRRDVRDIYVRR